MLRPKYSTIENKINSKVIINRKLLDILKESIRHSIDSCGEESDYEISNINSPDTISNEQKHSILLTVSSVSFKLLFVLTINNGEAALPLIAKQDVVNGYSASLTEENILSIIKEFANNFSGTAKRYLSSSYTALGMSTPHILNENTQYKNMMSLNPLYDFHIGVKYSGQNIMAGSVYFFSSDNFELILNDFEEEDTGTLDFF